jgi:hypothetical protein
MTVSTAVRAESRKDLAAERLEYAVLQFTKVVPEPTQSFVSTRELFSDAALRAAADSAGVLLYLFPPPQGRLTRVGRRDTFRAMRRFARHMTYVWPEMKDRLAAQGIFLEARTGRSGGLRRAPKEAIAHSADHALAVVRGITEHHNARAIEAVLTHGVEMPLIETRTLDGKLLRERIAALLSQPKPYPLPSLQPANAERELAVV